MTLAGLLEDPLAGRNIARGVQQIAVAAGVAAWLASLISALSGPVFYPSAYTAVAFAALGVPLVGAQARLRSIDGAARALQVFVVVTLVVHATELWAAVEPAGGMGHTPLNQVLTAGLVLTGVVFRPLVGVPLVIVDCALGFAWRRAVIGVPLGLAESTMFLASGLAAFVVVTTIRDELDALAVATSSALTAHSRAAFADRRSRARQQLDGLIHDKVLASLTLAARGQSEDAPGLAADALRSLAPDAAAPGEDAADARALILDHARSIGLDVTLDSEPWPDGPSGEALRAATCEALTNVVRHSGVRSASVRARQRGVTFVVEVSDAGIGFDPAAIPAGRLGVRDRIVGTLASLGGQANIDSQRGQGTRVIMTCAQDAAGALPVGNWLPRVMLRVAPVLALSMAGHLAAGALNLGQGLLVTVSVGGLIALPCLAVLLGVTPVGGRWWRASIAATVVTWVALLLNVAQPVADDWRWWFSGAFISPVVFISARRGLRLSLGVIVTSVGLGIVGLAVRGYDTFLLLTMASFHLLGWSIGIGWLKDAADRAGERTAEALQRRQAAELRMAQASALSAEIEARQQALDADVVPLLTRIASREPLTDAERVRCREVEAASRDHLVAGTLLSPELVAAIADARARGVRVTIVGRAERDRNLDVFRASAVRMLGLGRPRDRVTLRWAPDAAGVLGTLALVGPDVESLWPTDADADGVRASVDADSILLEVTADGPPNGGLQGPSPSD